jgi:bifunctional non-homologous end joining protein LigD
MKGAEVEIDGNLLNITHADRVLFPDDGITKGDVIDYYLEIAEVILPHVRRRAVNMHRFLRGSMEIASISRISRMVLQIGWRA